MKKFATISSITKIVSDFCTTVLGFILAYQFRINLVANKVVKELDLEQLPTEKEYLQFTLIIAFTLIATLAIKKSYLIQKNQKLTQELTTIFSGWITWIMILISYYFITRTFPFSRLAIFYAWSFSLVLIVIGRLILHTIRQILHNYGYGRTKVFFIGKNQITKELKKFLKEDQAYQIVKSKGEAEKIIQTDPKLDQQTNEDIVEYCELNHIEYSFTPDILDVRRSNIRTETIAGIPVINIKQTPLEGWGKVVKRIIDILGSSIMLIILSPVFLIIAIAIKLDSKGPIFYSAKRVGKKRKHFTHYKFRSMKPNTHHQRYNELSKHDTRQESPLVKIKKDPRVTKIGRFIRKYSIDELPQLWNILIGNMSLVGPRPHLPEEVEQYQKHHKFLLTIKPGLSGMAQISGRSDLNFEDEVKLDSYYIEKWSVWLDIKILLKTPLVVLRGHEE